MNIFISYARQDYPFAHKLVAALRNVSIKGWLDDVDIAAGSAVSSGLRSAINESGAMVVLVSPRSLESQWVNFEIGAGLAQDRPIIPILVEGADIDQKLPEVFHGMPVVDARNRPIGDVVRDLEEAMRAIPTPA
jgi:hypothetical protein